MLQLAEEKAQAEQTPPEPPKDSSDDWGTGSTAVLEPPRPGEEEAKPPREYEPIDSDSIDNSDFPIGFPLTDADWEGNAAPGASESDIAMLERMFGSRGEE